MPRPPAGGSKTPPSFAMRTLLPKSTGFILSATVAALLAGCASDDTPPPPPPTSSVSVGPSASTATVAPTPAPAYNPGATVVTAPAPGYASQLPEGALAAGRLSLPPIPVRQTRPVYPEDLRQSSTEGYAVVGFVVEPDGTVGYAQSISATNPEFGDAALTAVRGWNFQAGRFNGQLVKSYMEIPIYFTLSQPAPVSVAVNPAVPAAAALTPTAPAPVELTIPPLPQGVYDVSVLDQYPTPISQPSPRYPEEERRSGTQGYATVLFIVEADGTVSNILAVRATDSAFGDAASAAVSQWRFRPATLQGQPVRCRVLVPINFEMND